MHGLDDDDRRGGESYDVVIIGSMGSNPRFRFVNNPDNPTIADEFKQGFRVLRSLSPDVPLGSHPAMYNMAEKYDRIGDGPNPFVDPDGYVEELDAVVGALPARAGRAGGRGGGGTALTAGR